MINLLFAVHDFDFHNKPSGGQSEDDCLPCPGGFYCDQDGQTQPAGPCDQGYYCPANASIISPTPTGLQCPIGYHCPQQTADPKVCPEGQFQEIMGQWTCDPCPIGFYCPAVIPPTMHDCPPYNYCPEGF